MLKAFKIPATGEASVALSHRKPTSTIAAVKRLGFKLIITACFLLSISLIGCNQTEQKPVQHKISIKAAIIYSVGGAQAVARENFYLLKKDAFQIWKEAGLVKAGKNFWLDFSIERIYETKEKPLPYNEAVKPYIVSTATTDFEGNATFENVPEGTYYIYAITETRGDGFAVWSYKVSTDETKTILLDNKNAIHSE
ncbi:MAG: carboxypeptidase-like regulatory domain-containing protein [Acidobacteriota bacterium]|nr:carboxypeptidase-like regulatory domain-containing protein [Acidobacteriota bacterium]